MMPSGIEWLGDIPTHWAVEKPIYSGISITTGKVDVNIEDEFGKYPFFTCGRDVKRSQQYSFDCEALLVAGNGEVGFTQYYYGKFEAYQRTYVLSGFKRHSPRFAEYYFKANLITAVENKSSGSVIQFITMGDLRHSPIATPPLSEQGEIVKYLDYRTAEIDSLLAENERAISLLTERRRAVISAAVTGKIDVREREEARPSSEEALPQVAEKEGRYG